MQLLLRNNIIIEEPIENILNELKRAANWDVFATMNSKGDYIQLTCPFHKDGKETHPSCSVYTSYNSPDIIPGTYHCFTCGAKGLLQNLVSQVLDITDLEGEQWLADRFGSYYYGDEFNFPTSLFGEPEVKKEKKYLDESILDQYAWYHPYMASRNIDMETCRKFKIGWNQEKNTITFPVWDDRNNLIMVTERSIDTKRFYIPEGVEKPVYLLNYILQEKYHYTFICESQINALTCWSYGLPAVALFGTGTETQYEILKQSGLNGFILCFDGDDAGRKGARRFKKAMPDTVFITDIRMPFGKDVNDLPKEEFINLLKINGFSLDIR